MSVIGVSILNWFAMHSNVRNVACLRTGAYTSSSSLIINSRATNLVLHTSLSCFSFMLYTYLHEISSFFLVSSPFSNDQTSLSTIAFISLSIAYTYNFNAGLSPLHNDLVSAYEPHVTRHLHTS